MRISDWSSDVCASDLRERPPATPPRRGGAAATASAPCDRDRRPRPRRGLGGGRHKAGRSRARSRERARRKVLSAIRSCPTVSRRRSGPVPGRRRRSEEHTSELQSLMRISYAVFCLKKKKTQKLHTKTHNYTK